METETFTRDDIAFRYYDSKSGSTPLIFQHGIGGNLENVISLFKLPPETRIISMDCRGHGDTRPVGDLSNFTLPTFVDDVMALLDHLEIPTAIFGGMSMGAAEAMNAAVRYPDRLKGLILYRPAWLDGAMTDFTQSLYKQLVELIRGYGPAEGQKRFSRSETYAYLLKNYPDTAKSILSQFTAKGALENIIRFERLPYQRAVDTIAQISAIRLPTLVISTKIDPVHPFEYGQCLAALIPDAIFKEATAKSINVEKHLSESEKSICSFIEEIR